MNWGSTTALVVAAAVVATGCSNSPSAEPAGEAVTTVTAMATTTVTTTTTATATATATATTTATATVTATATKTVLAQPEEPAGPLDVTADYTAHARSVRMARDQQYDIVQVTVEAGVVNVLTLMKTGWGGWACEWEPAQLAGQTVKYVRILYQDGSLFRICQ